MFGVVDAYVSVGMPDARHGPVASVGMGSGAQRGGVTQRSGGHPNQSIRVFFDVCRLRALEAELIAVTCITIIVVVTKATPAKTTIVVVAKTPCVTAAANLAYFWQALEHLFQELHAAHAWHNTGKCECVCGAKPRCRQHQVDRRPVHTGYMLVTVALLSMGRVHLVPHEQ